MNWNSACGTHLEEHCYYNISWSRINRLSTGPEAWYWYRSLVVGVHLFEEFQNPNCLLVYWFTNSYTLWCVCTQYKLPCPSGTEMMRWSGSLRRRSREASRCLLTQTFTLQIQICVPVCCPASSLPGLLLYGCGWARSWLWSEEETVEDHWDSPRLGKEV